MHLKKQAQNILLHIYHEKRHYRVGFSVEEHGHLVGKTLQNAGFMSPGGCELMLMSLDRGRHETPITPDYVMQGGELLTFSCDIDHLPDLWAIIGLMPYNSIGKMESERYTHTLVEAVVSPSGSFVGRRVSEMLIPESPYRIWVVAISRQGKTLDERISAHIIEAEDDIVMEVDDAFFHEHRNETEFLMVRRLRGAHIQRTDRATAASVITIAMVAIVTLGWMSMLNAALLATGAMLFTGCMTITEAARSISYSTLIAMAAAIGLEGAVDYTGLAENIAHLLASMGGTNPFIAVAAVFVGAVFISNFIAHAAAVALMFPIALSMATDLGISFMPFAIIIMLGASYSFISPTGYQTNLMVYGPGGYQFTDFFKIGIPLTIVVGIVSVLLTPLFFQF